MMTFKVNYMQANTAINCCNLVYAECKDDVIAEYERFGRVLSVEAASEYDVEEAREKHMPIITVEKAEKVKKIDDETWHSVQGLLFALRGSLLADYSDDVTIAREYGIVKGYIYALYDLKKISDTVKQELLALAYACRWDLAIVPDKI